MCPRNLPDLGHVVRILRIADATEELVIVPTFIFILHLVAVGFHAVLPVIKLMVRAILRTTQAEEIVLFQAQLSTA